MAVAGLRGACIVRDPIVAGVAGCSKSREQCRAEADELVAFLRASDLNVPPFFIAPAVVPTRDDVPARSLPFAEDVRVLSDGIDHEGQLFTRIDDVVEHMKRRRARHAGSKLVDPDRIYLLVDKRVTWDRVVAAFEALVQAGFTKPMFVFVGSRVAPRPPPSKLDARLDAISQAGDRSENAAKLAAIISELVENCDAMKKPFVNHAAADEKSRTERFFEELPQDLVACRCGVDLASLRSVLWRVMAAPVPTYYVAVEATRDGAVVRARSTATWDEVGRRLDPSATKLWLEVAD